MTLFLREEVRRPYRAGLTSTSWKVQYEVRKAFKGVPGNFDQNMPSFSDLELLNSWHKKKIPNQAV